MTVETRITIYLGQDQNLAITVTDSAGAAQAQTGWATEFVLRRDLYGAADLTLTSAGGAIAYSNGEGTDDVGTVSIADTDTLNLPSGEYHWSYRRTDAGSEVPMAHGIADLQLLSAR